MTSRNALLVTAVAAASAVAVLAPVATASAAPLVSLPVQTLHVDSRTGTAQTSVLLIPGATYTVKVSGTYSAYAASLYNQPAGSYFATCGTPVSAPRYPSPGVTNGPTGADAEFLFAAPHKPFKCGNFDPPYLQDKFRVSSGGAYAHPTPIGGRPTSPSAHHSYAYHVKAGGLLAPLKFQVSDTTYGDNYGRLKISISLDVL